MSSSSLDSSAPQTRTSDPDGLQLPDPVGRRPIRAELLGLERLEARARRLSRARVMEPRHPTASPLLKRFHENRRVLHHAQQQIMGHERQEVHGIDADWLADNFHIVDEVLREVRLDLPRGYDAILPKLGEPPLAGYPRVHALALALVAHTDSELDENRITRFVQAFQESVPLSIGELWALPTMCRLVLIENLRRLAEEMLWRWAERQRAERWCAQVVGPAHASPDHASTARLSAAEEPSPPVVVRLAQLLRDQGPNARPGIEWLESLLSGHRINLDEIVGREHRRQAANQITVGNCVLSLRVLSAVDWNAFFERCSLVERILREDPAGVYPHQDFATSDRYRKAVERIARRSDGDELTVARKAVDLAGAGHGQARGHVGFYLVDRGERELKSTFRYRPRGGERILEGVLAHPRLVYFGAITALLAGAILLLARVGIARDGAGGWFLVLAAILAAFLPLSDLVIGLVNHLLTLILPPRVLPKLEFKGGIPENFTTFVVMPSMLVKPRNAEVLCERLETHYLANPNARVRFALLTDFADSPQEEMPTDQALIQDALERIRALNEKYAGDGPEVFFLFHRRRLYNPSQGCWMGWERKRGKLSEFNRLLRGHRDTTYAVMSTDPAALPRTRFVITLDADTQMPRDTVDRLIGTLAHPLNLPRFDPAAGRVVEGYGVLQPRVSFHLTAATHSHFAGLLAASGGIDPYSTAASDAYMDLFGLGSFTGKGIYDLDAFEAATGETFPENQILSHDLIEGNYARCGLLSDTELFDDFPARYHAYARREHRWVRGDWQLLPWLGRRVPAPEGKRLNPLPLIERWKLFDNLRRSLVPPALVVMLALGWTILPGSPWLWTSIALAVLALPLLKWLIGASLGSIRSRSLTPLKSWRESLRSMGGQSLLAAIFLADQARSLCDAIARTLWRLGVSHRRLLEWETAASTEQRLGAGLRDFVAGMWGAPALAMVITAAVAWFRPAALWAAGPLLFAWLVSPLIAFWISQPRPRRSTPLTAEERLAFRRIARKTWQFFETFVTAEDHWLPPDNFQEVPDGRLAHRTSPTNQGLLLISTLAAHDLGYLGFIRLVERLEKTFDSLERMERHWGHFYNWYDTRTLQPLPPAYISTVDSGNLLGCLVALKQGLKDKLREPVAGPAVKAGLLDTYHLMGEAQGRLAPGLEPLFREEPESLDRWANWLERLEREAADLADRIGMTDFAGTGNPDDDGRWATLLHSLARERRVELATLASLTDAAMVHERQGSGVPMAAEDAALRDRLLGLIGRAEAIAAAMDFGPLYKSDRHLYAIGANLSQGQLDGSCYDLLASESCLTSYLTVARGTAPRKHWFQLGRPFIRAAGRTGLISWGGTMFEYLMPRLLLRSLEGTLLAEALETAVARQIEYGRQLGIPWGVSESAFGAQYLEGDYRYQSFGVPGLGLKRGLEQDRVIAPYATAMATMIAPREALANFKRLAGEGGEGPFGFYEAIDYTPDRLSAGQRSVVVKSYMAHHQGMSLVALTNVLCDDVMPRRFHADPAVRAAELLLQERIPPETPIVEPAHLGPSLGDAARPGGSSLLSRRLTSPHTAAPRTHLLSNARYHVMVTNAGSGYSRCQGMDLTRWREDPTCEHWGQFFYIRDVHSGVVWSASHQPVCRPADEYEVVFAADKATFRRRDGDIETQLEITVSPEQLAEVRRITLTNYGSQIREVELTSYMEPVLAPHGADMAHPAYGKLFVETEYVASSESLLCRRRPRSRQEQPLWGIHVLAVDRSAPGCELVGEPQYETDRARFIGRGRTIGNPLALSAGHRLSGSSGPVLDPVFSLRRRFRIAPGGSAVVGSTLATADLRDAGLALADTYHSISAVARAFELAWAQSQVEHGHGSAAGEDAHLYQRLASHLIFASAALRTHASPGETTGSGYETLSRHGLSIDRPIMLTRVAEPVDLSLVQQLLTAHDFLRQKGIETDLVVVNQERSEDAEALDKEILSLVESSGASDRVRQPGGVFVLRNDPLTEPEAMLLEAAARVVFDGARGALAAQLDRNEWVRARPEALEPTLPVAEWNDPPVEPPPGLQFFNGLGGFTADGREYCMMVAPPALDKAAGPLHGQKKPETTRYPVLPPAPWVNVIANPDFGFLVSEAGAGFTWAGNSQTNRLSPWSNDPVMDLPAEVIYIRDEETGEFWCPTPLPIPSNAPTLVRHGQGYTVFTRNAQGVEHELCLFVPPTEPVKLLRLKLRNSGTRPRTLSATFFMEWVLGSCREQTAPHVATEVDPETGALLARNPFRQDHALRVAFADVNRRPRSVTGDRGEFLGRHGTLATPAAMGRKELSGRTGIGLDPCAGIQSSFVLGPGETMEIVFLVGEAEDAASARELIRRNWDSKQVSRSLVAATSRWEEILGTVQVQTADPAFDLLLNRWLLYQVISCRLDARSGFYQSGGAFGFRDQLQDVLAVLHAAPELARTHLLRAAARQFIEGDVQHWWHPPAGRGVRTRISDDLFWLPYATAIYVKITGDAPILNERVSYLTAPVLRSGQEDDYREPAVSPMSGTLYEHCVRALEHGTRLGQHGLPLMGSGDWNDGMNRVGVEGRGESVWLAWFLVSCLRGFAPIAENCGDQVRADRFLDQANALCEAVEAHGWDGAWYLRAFTDEGTPVGSAQGSECQIDSIAQTWSVLSGAGNPERSRTAMESVRERLVRPQDALILLLSPPFDGNGLDPGYIKGYLPGTRENGAQYTHAATWVVQAFASLGRGTLAHELFRMINPILHAAEPSGVQRYAVEPYVVVGDVYSAPAHAGRGGWSWYTGAAGWLYRVGIECILGLQRCGDRLRIEPCLHADWKSYQVLYRYRSTTYHITVLNPEGIEHGTASLFLDGHPCLEGETTLVDDGATHLIRLVIGNP